LADVPLRRAVSKLDRSHGIPQELKDYADGVRAMMERPLPDPLGWVYQARIHGFRQHVDPAHPDWDKCQHQQWFFLPWHRMYVRQLEKIIGHLIGKPDWRIPYWDYTSPDEADWALPPEFADPPDPDTNPLFVPGRSPDPLQESDRDPAAALAARFFTTHDNLADDFGSGVIHHPAQFGHRETGQLEYKPHNQVHNAVGGLMENPLTAAADPIFWLHHASIDRLWEVWRADGHTNETDSGWLGTTFDFPDPDVGRKTYKVSDVLSTEALGYAYDDLTPPPVAAPEPLQTAFLAAEALEEAAVDERREPELIGATAEAVPLEPDSTHTIELAKSTTLRLSEEPVVQDAAGPEAFAQAITELALGRKVFLQLENVTGRNVAVGIYGIYLDVPEGERPADHPELKAGEFPTFGLEAATADGGGITQAIDITDVARRLYNEGRWNPDRLQVSFDAERLTSNKNVAGQAVHADGIRVYVV
jgi:tyrosinase